MKRERRPRRGRAPRGGSSRKKVLAGGLAGGAAMAVGTPGYAVPIRIDGPMVVLTDSQPQYALDLNNDSDPDLVLEYLGSQTYGNYGWAAPTDDEDQPRKTHILIDPINSYLTRWFDAGQTIGPGGAVMPLAGLASLGYYYYNPGGSYPVGPFAGGNFINNRGYMGLKFDVGADEHWGWVEVEVIQPGYVQGGKVFIEPSLNIYSWGYETEPNTGIEAGAPEPGTLVSLAIGAAAVAGGRRRRKA